MIHHLRRDALVLTAIAAVFVAAVVMSLHASWQQKLADGRQLTEGVVRALVIRLERDLVGAEQGLEEIIATLRDDPDRLHPADAQTERLVTTLRRFNPSVASFGVMRRDGRIIASSTPGLAADPTARTGPTLTSPFSANFVDRIADRARLSATFIRRSDGAQLFALSRPIRDMSGELIAAAYATFPVNSVLTTLAPLTTKHEQRVILMNADFRIIASRPDDLIGRDMTGSPLFRAVASGKHNGTIETNSAIYDREVITSFECSEAFGFIAVNVTDRDMLLGAWFNENRAQIAMLTLLPLTGIALAIALVAAHRRRSFAEQALAAQAESRLRQGMESTRDGFCIWDHNGKLLIWNQCYADITSYLSTPLRIGLSFGDMIRCGAVAIFPDLDPAAREAWCQTRETAWKRADGTTREFTSPAGRMIEIADRRTSNGDVVTNLRDVTEERMSQQRLADSQARFRDGIESMADGFMLWDAEDRLVTWNQRTLELLPYLRQLAVVGTSFVEHVAAAIRLARPDWTPQQHEAWLTARLDKRRRNEPHEIALSDDRTIEIVERATSQGGRVTILRDITTRRNEQVATERALAAERDTNAQQRRFVSIASHEFRTPLAIIDSAVQRLEVRLGTNAGEEIKKRLTRIRDAVARMTRIIDITLSSARLEDGQIKPEPTLFDLAELLRDVVARQRTISPSLDFALALPSDGLVISADRPLLDQVFTNLLSNAAKYSPRASRVEIGAAVAADRLEIMIRDYGVGIPADELPKLFTRFFRARTAAGIPGTGIGLHLVQELVALHGGTIEVQSDAGLGSTFTVRLPRAMPIGAQLGAAAD